MRLRNLHHAGRTAAARAGFTLMELLVVVAILLVLIGVATPLYMNYLEQSKGRVAKSDAHRLAGELRNYAVSHDGNWPNPDTWDLLPLPPEQKPPLDPWKRPFHWTMREIQHGDGTTTMDPVVWSTGPTGNLDASGGYSSISQ
jgi:general secretion pathway protein G